MKTGTLHLIPTPLDFGTAGEVDLREVLPMGVIRTAAGLEHWVVENAKTARAFLKRVNTLVPLGQPLQALSIVELPRTPKGGGKRQGAIDMKPLLEPLLRGADVGLMSEAGMPAVADPGAALVQAAHGLSIPVSALPGPSALLLALAASGLNGQSFAFVGYLPVESAQRAQRIKELEALSQRATQTQLMIETPYRNEALLAALVSQLKGSTWLSVSCGLTLAGGWTRTDRVAAWKGKLSALPSDIPAVFGVLAD